jgi:release factor glutamine methyltransferase
MRLVTPPGVFRPHSDSLLLADHLREVVEPGAVVADICTGSGVLAVAAACAGAGDVTAVDVSRRAVLTAWINARLNGVSVRARRGDLFAPLYGERFDLIVSNPPYVPAADDELPTHGRARAWDAGRDGRALIDRICAQAPARLRPGGAVLVVHSSVCDADRTVSMLAQGGLVAEVVTRSSGPLGPLLRERKATLEQRGLLPRDARAEELVLIRGRRSATGESGFDGPTPGSALPHDEEDENVSILDKITGRAKKAAGDIAGDPGLRKQGRREERKGEAKEEATEAQQRAEDKQREADDLERRT